MQQTRPGMNSRIAVIAARRESSLPVRLTSTCGEDPPKAGIHRSSASRRPPTNEARTAPPSSSASRPLGVSRRYVGHAGAQATLAWIRSA